MNPTEEELAKIIQTLTRAGAVISFPDAPRCLSAKSVAALLDVKADWVREHLSEFPGWFRLPGGGRNGGEIRIPASDVKAFEKRRNMTAARAAEDRP